MNCAIVEIAKRHTLPTRTRHVDRYCTVKPTAGASKRKDASRPTAQPSNGKR